MTIRDWDIVTSYVDSVTTSLKTVTFPKVQESVKVLNQGNANLTYTIGSQSGTLTPGQSVKVLESISSFTIQSSSSVQSFEVRAVEKGTEQTETETDVMSQLAEKAAKTDLNYVYPEQSSLYATNVAQGINDMATYASTNGYILRFKRGKEYIINQYINIPSGLTVDLNGAKITRNYDKSQYPTIRLAGNNEIFGGEVNGNQSNIPDAATNFINYTDLWTMGDNIKIHDMNIHDSCGECIRVASNNVQIYNNTFGRALDHQIYMKPTDIATQSYSNIRIWNNKCIDNVTTRELLKVSDGNDNILIEDNYFEATTGWFITCDNSPSGGNIGTVRVRNNIGKCLYFAQIGNAYSSGLQSKEIVYENNDVIVSGKIFKQAVDSDATTRKGFYVNTMRFVANTFVMSNASITYPIELDSIQSTLIEFERNIIDWQIVSPSPYLMKVMGVIGNLKFKSNIFIPPTNTQSEFNNVVVQILNPPTGAVDGTNCKTILFDKNTFLKDVSPLLNDVGSGNSAFLWDMIFTGNNFVESTGIVRLVNSNATDRTTVTKKIVASKNFNRGGIVRAVGTYNTTAGIVTTDLIPLQTDSGAADVTTLKNDFNALLAKLKNAGFMSPS